MFTPEGLEMMAADIRSLGLDEELAGDCAADIGDTPVIIDGHLVVGDERGLLAVLPEWVVSGEGSARLPALPEEVRWHRLAEWREGMCVESAEGKRCTVFWEQKPTLVRIGILALCPENFADNEALNVKLYAGELEDLDADSSVGGCIRDAELMAIWKKRSKAWEEQTVIE